MAQEMLMVTNQPETLALNKYLGFKQLSYIEEKGFSCVIPIEVEECLDNTLVNSSSHKLWTVRVATITGKDFDLPSIIGVDKTTALQWIEQQREINHNFVFFYSEYFEPKISGRIHIEYFSTRIEMSLGDFHSFKHSIPDLSTTCNFNQIFVNKIDKHLIDAKFIKRVIYLSKRLKQLYQEEFMAEPGMLYEYDFAFIPKNDLLELKIIGMRAYVEKDKQYGMFPPSVFEFLSDLYKNELFKIE